MPPKAKISREMIVEEAFQIARTQGADKITARSISQRLNCSTQPILYYFATIEDIRAAVYQRADRYHTRILTGKGQDYENSLLDMGMNYIRFAAEEKNLFRLLFQSNEFSGVGLIDLIRSEESSPMIQALRRETKATADEALEIFTTLFVFVHGYASLLANNEMPCDEERLAASLKRVYEGAVYSATCKASSQESPDI